MNTYQAVKAQIARLEERAEKLRRNELASAVAKVKAMIESFKITPEDLGFKSGDAGSNSGRARGRGTAKTQGKAKRTGAGVAKYRDPESGKTWSGFGRAPAWIADARDRDRFLIADADGPSDGEEAGGAEPTTARKASNRRRRGQAAAKSSTSTLR